jgi:hypothetical protein
VIKTGATVLGEELSPGLSGLRAVVVLVIARNRKSSHDCVLHM